MFCSRSIPCFVSKRHHTRLLTHSKHHRVLDMYIDAMLTKIVGNDFRQHGIYRLIKDLL